MIMIILPMKEHLWMKINKFYNPVRKSGDMFYEHPYYLSVILSIDKLILPAVTLLTA